MEVTNEPVGQMTIFYRGKVNVFDDVSGDKVMKQFSFFVRDPAIVIIILVFLSIQYSAYRHEY